MGWSCERRDAFVDAVQLAGHECAVFDVRFPKGATTPPWVEKQIAMLAGWLKRLPARWG